MNSPTALARVKGWLKGAGLFVGIVWSIALAFVALEYATSRFLDWGYNSGTIPDTYALPTPSAEAVAKCAAVVAAPDDGRRPVLEAETFRQHRFMAWKMGFGFGFAVGLERAGAIDQAQLNASLDAIMPLGQALHVPTPVLPASGSAAGAIADFGQRVEDDTACTAVFLAHRYDSSFGHLYKLGALIGFGTVYRTLCVPCGALFVPQIRYHAKDAGLPEHLWHAFTEPPPNGPSTEERQKNAMALVESFEQSFSARD